MDLLQLRYFYESANSLSISKTAEQFNVPATSVSASIRRLETELGCKLFERTPNRIFLNEKGQIMRDSLEKIFNELDQMMQSVSEYTNDHKEIRILAKAIRSLITEQIIQYKRSHTQTHFKLVANFDEKDFQDYDLIIDTQRDLYAGYQCIELGKRNIYFYVPISSPLYSQKFKLHQLSKMPFAIMGQHGNHMKILVEACKKAGFTPNIVARVNDSACFRRIIASGIAIGVTGEFAQSDEGSGRLVPLNVTDFKYQQPICLYYDEKKLHGNTAGFVKFLRENMKNTISKPEHSSLFSLS